MHTVEFHLSLALIQSLGPILPRLRLLGPDGRELARELRASATAIPRALAAAALAARSHVAARHRSRAHALARHVHALLLTGHAWHYELPGLRSLALVRAEHLAEYLARSREPAGPAGPARRQPVAQHARRVLSRMAGSKTSRPRARYAYRTAFDAAAASCRARQRGRRTRPGGAGVTGRV